MKKIIINADDFGLTEGVNNGIVRAYREGILTSASLMVNMPGFEDALKLIRENPGLDIGIHINIVRGKPVLPAYKVRTLTDKNGFFLRDIFKILKGIYQKKISLTELEFECDAQIKKALDRGIIITHLDSEKHLHLIKSISEICIKLIKTYGIFKMRVVNELAYLRKLTFNPLSIFRAGLYKTLLVNLASKQVRVLNQMHSVKNPDYSYGLYESGNMTAEKYEKLFYCLKDGVTEIICHPGYIAGEQENSFLYRERYHLNVAREHELHALLNPKLKELFRKLNIRLISYKEM